MRNTLMFSFRGGGRPPRDLPPWLQRSGGGGKRGPETTCPGSAGRVDRPEGPPYLAPRTARSSNGKTTDSDSVNRGSNPRRASRLPLSRAEPVCQTRGLGGGDGGHAQRLFDGCAGKRASDGQFFRFATAAGLVVPVDPAGIGRGGRRRLSDRPELRAAIAPRERLT